jgi:hypothetical protein
MNSAVASVIFIVTEHLVRFHPIAVIPSRLGQAEMPGRRSDWPPAVARILGLNGQCRADDGISS